MQLLWVDANAKGALQAVLNFDLFGDAAACSN
jgi:hypothetical protein